MRQRTYLWSPCSYREHSSWLASRMQAVSINMFLIGHISATCNKLKVQSVAVCTNHAVSSVFASPCLEQWSRRYKYKHI